jgi:uncharacterized protein (DUF58 family)
MRVARQYLVGSGGTVAVAALATIALMLFALSAWGRALPKSTAATTPEGTISGTVRGPNGPGAVHERIVEVVNLSTGERRRMVTNRAGAFTFQVKPGKYRLELMLKPGERLASQPGIIHLGGTALEAHADIVLGRVPVSRPRSPAYRIADGLGSPVA